jgi:suppressor of fused
MKTKLISRYFIYRAGGPWLVTDMRRGESMLELDPSVAEEVARGINNDGSNLSGVSARCSWAEHANPSYIVSI